MNKKEVLSSLLAYGALSSHLSVGDLLEHPTLRNVKYLTLGKRLQRLHRQGLLNRQGKGVKGNPYKYKLTIRGIRRLEYFENRDKGL